MKTLKISKSQYLRGLQCPKSLWYSLNRPNLCKEYFNNHTIFNEGIEVGELARLYFKTGIKIDFDFSNIQKSIEYTLRAIKENHQTIFEAAACSDEGAFCIIDVLKKVDSSEYWDLIEIKMSTKVKDHHIDDMAYQRYVFLNSGYKIRKSILMHINNEYVRQGDIDLKQLFILENCTDDVVLRLSTLQQSIKTLIDTAKLTDKPNIKVGDQCKKPFFCEYNPHCSPKISEYPINEIFTSGQKLKELIDAGINDIKEIPANFKLTDRETIAVNSVKKNLIHFDKKAIKNFLDQLKFPLYYLDYETIYPAIPLFDESRPFQQIPFQYSIHIQNEKFGQTKHIDFLHENTTDPRPAFIKHLINDCNETGSIIVYNKAFESRINKELGEQFPKHRKELLSISDRMVDLLIPFRTRVIYHPEMRGSASIKKVLPAFVPELNYDGMEITEGVTASLEYLKCIKNLVADREKTQIFRNLKEYCTLDTKAEVVLLNFLYEKALTNNHQR